MVKEQLSRKLAVILHADVVGSTSLVHRNETLAHERIQAVFQQFSETINSYGGITRELRGDALLAEFERASDAVPAALAFQVINGEFNSRLDDDIQPQLRIGISLGEVIIADNTITGAGVVLAQRLEQLADAGGVVIQGSVSETVPNRLPFEFESLGEKQLKGFDNPVRAFIARLQQGEEIPAPEARARADTNAPGDSQAPLRLTPESYEALTGERFEFPEKPSIAVLPFQNMNGDPEQEYFADGMSEDIITALSKMPDLIVIARNSTFVYKGRAVDIRQVGQELGVRHVLEGSIRKSGDRIRITAQLVSAESGDHIWAERYDRTLDDVFAVQDEITRNIIIELRVKLGRGDGERNAATSTTDIRAWELVIRAQKLMENASRDDDLLARQMVLDALELDSDYATAWISLGWIYWREATFKFTSDPEGSLQIAYDTVQKVLSINPDDPDALTLLGNIYMAKGDIAQSIDTCERAVELAPSNSLSVSLLGNVLLDAGRVTEGIQKMKRAIRLCPFPPLWFFALLGIGYHLNGDNKAAIFALELAIEHEPDNSSFRLWYCSALVEMSRLEDAAFSAKSILENDPSFSTAAWAKRFKSKSHERLEDNLLAAGLPE